MIIVAIVFMVASLYACKSPQMTPETVEDPVFTPAAGKVAAGTEISIKCDTPGTDIYYTMNGDAPTEESTKYTEPVKITSATTFKAIAIKPPVADDPENGEESRNGAPQRDGGDTGTGNDEGEDSGSAGEGNEGEDPENDGGVDTFKSSVVTASYTIED